MSNDATHLIGLCGAAALVACTSLAEH